MYEDGKAMAVGGTDDHTHACTHAYAHTCMHTHTWLPKIGTHTVRGAIYALLLELELNDGSNVSYDVHLKDGVHHEKPSVTLRQAGPSKNAAEARLSFKEHKTVEGVLEFEKAVEAQRQWR